MERGLNKLNADQRLAVWTQFNPYKYLLYILQTAPAMNLEQDVQQLLPLNVQLNK